MVKWPPTPPNIEKYKFVLKCMENSTNFFLFETFPKGYLEKQTQQIWGTKMSQINFEILYYFNSSLKF